MQKDTTETIHGTVQGEDRGGVIRFLGMHYGADTSGPNRFRPPQPVTPWSGVRDATTFGPISPQPASFFDAENYTLSEDCLVLNVWTPSTEGKRAVLFWIHGGGYVIGQSNDDISDGERLARDEDVVVVSINHRLGILGFFDLEGIDGDHFAGSGNAGILDIVAALEWVRDNIASFGGDPDAVTIFGHSGGGGKVSSLLSMPAARGLFRAAGVHGGPPFGLKDHDAATKIALDGLSRLGIAPSDARSIQDVPLERISQLQLELGAGALPGGPNGMPFSPVLKTDAFPRDPYETLADGFASDVMLLTGTSLDEARFGMLNSPEYRDPSFTLSDEDLLRRVVGGFDDPSQAPELIARYAALDPDASNLDRMFDILSDQMRIRTLRLADAKRTGGGGSAFVYLCEINHNTPPLGACHGMEMPFFFNRVDADPFVPTSPEREELAVPISHALAQFAKTLIPGSTELPWPQYDPAVNDEAVLDEGGISVQSRPHEERRRAWDDVVLSPYSDPWGALHG